MKITIDTLAKTIEVESHIQFGELVKGLEKLLPEWQEYKLLPKTEHQQWFPNIPIYTPSTQPFFVPPPMCGTITIPNAEGKSYGSITLSNGSCGEDYMVYTS